MASNTIQDSLLETMNIIAKANDNKNVQTITIEAVIESVVDVEKGIYTANYLNNKIQVYSAGSTYKEKQQVYVLVPNGDFTKKKIIISAIDDEPRDTTEQGNKEFVFASNNIIADGDMPYSLCSYKNNSFTWEALKAINSNLLHSYSKKQKTYKLGCHIRTSLPSEQIIKRGYYYLKFSYSIMIGGESMPQEVILDINNILGNPYQLNTWTEQGIIFSIPEDAEIDKNIIPTLTVGCLNFIQDDDETESDIFFKNFSLHALEDASAVKGYFLYLTATDGFYMNPPQITSTTLIPELRYDGKKVDLKGAECFWFEKDTSITQESENYFGFGGNGWACLNLRKTVVDEKGKEYVVFESDNSFSKKIIDSYIVSSKTYKCLIIKDNAKYSAEVEITQLNSTLDFTLEPDSKTYVKNSGNVKITARTDFALSVGEKLSFYWERSDKNKKYLDNNFFTVESNTGSTETIVFPTRKIDTVNYISCSLHSSIRGLIATKTVDISTTENLTYQIVIENADVTFKYDANGKSPLAGAGYTSENATAAKIAPITFKVYKDNGDELTVSEYLECKVEWKFPKHKTLLKPVEKWNIETDDYYIYNGDPIKDEDDETNDDTTAEDKAKAKMSLKYDIAVSYNNSYTNNTIYLTVIFGDKKINEVIQPYFLMDGAIGTNGTKMTTVIRYKGYAYNELNENGENIRCRLYYYYDYSLQKWTLYDEEGIQIDPSSEGLDFIAYVYDDGELVVKEDGTLIDSSLGISNATWSLVDKSKKSTAFEEDYVSSLEQKPFLCTYYPKYDEAEQNSINSHVILKVDIKYANRTVNTYYPIYVVIIQDENLTLKEALSFNMEGGFSTVLYNNTGYYPIYDKTPFKLNVAEKLLEDSCRVYSISKNNSLYVGKPNEDIIALNSQFLKESFKINAADRLIQKLDAHKQDYIICSSLFNEKTGNYSWVYHKPVIILYNAYSLTSLNDWDGEEVKINDKESIFAPLIGAGKKDGLENKFTGFLMGDIKEENLQGGSSLIPRFSAYKEGKRTFNIDANTGKVTIGAYDSGQIEIDPSSNDKSAIIKSGNYKEGSLGEGMEINFSKPHIKFGSGCFEVNSLGHMTAKAGGSIAGWAIGQTSLYSSNNEIVFDALNKQIKLITGGSIAVGEKTSHDDNRKGLFINENGISLGYNDKFKVDEEGKLYATNVSIKGSFNNDKFKVDRDGNVTATSINIPDDGIITLTNSGKIQFGDMYIDKNGLSIKEKSSQAFTFGPFKSDINSIYAIGEDGLTWSDTTAPTVFMCTGSIGENIEIAGHKGTGWCFGAGSRFGVKVDGSVYCSAIKVTGTNDENGNSSSYIGNMNIHPNYISIELGKQSDDSFSYYMTLGPHTWGSIDYLFSITKYTSSSSASGGAMFLGIKADGATVNNM